MLPGFTAGVADPLVVLASGATAVGGVGGYAVHSLLRRRAGSADGTLGDLSKTVTSLREVALVVPANPDVDAIAAAVGLEALCKEWGVPARLFAEGRITGEDATAFCNLFDVDVVTVERAVEELSDVDGAIAVGGGASLPNFGNAPPLVAVVRHRPVAADHPLLIVRNQDGATSTTVATLLERGELAPDQRVATALLYGIRAGTSEFRRVRSTTDWEAASYLHEYADHGRIEALRSPGMSGETFDVIGEAIANRERRASVAVTNAGKVPGMSALEEAAETLLGLDGVSTAAAFGVHDGTVVVSCRAEDVRTDAVGVLDDAFEQVDAVGGSADAATARVPLGLFAKLDVTHQRTLDDLIDASTRKALFGAIESN